MSFKDLYYKIGRNLICYQAIEKNIKMLIQSSKIIITNVSGQLTQLDNSSIYQSNSFGTLVDLFFKKYILLDEFHPKDEISTSFNGNDLFYSGRFTISMDKLARSNLKKQMQSIVTERNVLVHNFIENREGILNTEDESNQLDEQYEKAKSVLDYITTIIKNRNKQFHYFQTDQFKFIIMYPEILETLSNVYSSHKESSNLCRFSFFLNEINSNHIAINDEIKSEYNFQSWSYFLEKLGFIELKSLREENKTILYFRMSSPT